jgi:hypothetical protein
MTDSIENIIKLKKIDEPAEFKQIKEFVAEKCGVMPRLQANKNQIIIYIPSAAMAGNLRFELYQIQEKIRQRLVIRIG